MHTACRSTKAFSSRRSPNAVIFSALYPTAFFIFRSVVSKITLRNQYNCWVERESDDIPTTPDVPHTDRRQKILRATDRIGRKILKKKETKESGRRNISHSTSYPRNKINISSSRKRKIYNIHPNNTEQEKYLQWLGNAILIARQTQNADISRPDADSARINKSIQRTTNKPPSEITNSYWQRGNLFWTQYSQYATHEFLINSENTDF